MESESADMVESATPQYLTASQMNLQLADGQERRGGGSPAIWDHSAGGGWCDRMGDSHRGDKEQGEAGGFTIYLKYRADKYHLEQINILLRQRISSMLKWALF